jgi:hypothetical protein|tara:strand:- start:62 stop:265 length:204 start_codon:yes stop_codon:yes gene_type:complete
MLKVKDYPNLIRDPKSKGVINTDRRSFDDYKNRKNLNYKVLDMDNEINNIKNDISEIKNLILQMAKK